MSLLSSGCIILWIRRSFAVFHSYLIQFITEFIGDISRFLHTLSFFKKIRHMQSLSLIFILAGIQLSILIGCKP